MQFQYKIGIKPNLLNKFNKLGFTKIENENKNK